MEPETLKELLTAFRELSAEAKGAFIWYIVLSRLPGILWTFGGIGLLWGLLRLGKYVTDVVAWGEALRQACGIRGVCCGSERRQILDCLEKHYKKMKID